jgi:hypothetical protein
MMNKDLEKIWRDAVMTSFKVLTQHLLEGTEENYNKAVRAAGLRAEELQDLSVGSNRRLKQTAQ